MLNAMDGDSEEKIAEEREYLWAIEGREGSECKFDLAYDLRNATLQKSCKFLGGQKPHKGESLTFLSLIETFSVGKSFVDFNT